MALWKQKEDWTYEYFDLDEDVSTFIGAESFVELWNTKRGNRRVPRWSDYDWDDLFPWWGSLVVSDVFWEPYDYRYRLYGTNVVNKIGIDVTGKRASELIDINYVDDTEMEFYEMVGRNLHITKTSGLIRMPGREHIKETFVELPLSDTGDRATHGLALLV